MSRALNRSSFVDAALAVIAEVGVERLSMRRVASQLGVSAMAMYKHFTNKDELLAAAFEEFIARADVLPDTQLDWDQWLEKLAINMYNALSADMSWVPILGSLRLGGNAIAVTDSFVNKLGTAGFGAEVSVRAYMAMIQLVVGAVCMRASLQAEVGREGRRKAVVSELSPITRSYLQNADRQRLAIAPALEAVVSDEPISMGLPLLISGLRQQLAAAD